jgi:hypothetical protein
MEVEHLLEVGGRDAVERMAHVLLELGARLAVVGVASWAGYARLLSQYLLAVSDVSTLGADLRI